MLALKLRVNLVKGTLYRNGRRSLAFTPSHAIAGKYIDKLSMSFDKDKKRWSLLYSGEPIKSPSNHSIAVDSPLIGQLLIDEWATSKSSKSSLINNAAIASLVYRAIDLENDNCLAQDVLEELLRFIHTDSICYLSECEETAALQRSSWEPILVEIQSMYSLPSPLKMSSTFRVAFQDPENVKVFRNLMETEMTGTKLAGFEHAVKLFKSFLIPVALFRGLISVEEANIAANMETNIQASKWGSIEEVHVVNNLNIMVGSSLAHVFMSS